MGPKVIWESQVVPTPFAHTWRKVPRTELRRPQPRLCLGAGARAQFYLSPLAPEADLLQKPQIQPLWPSYRPPRAEGRGRGLRAGPPSLA